MEAVLSAHSGSALVFHEGAIELLDGAEFRVISNSQAAQWFASHEEVRWCTTEERADVARELNLYCRRREALDLALMGCDTDFSTELRLDAIAALDSALQDSQVEEWLSEYFHIRPLPVSWVATADSLQSDLLKVSAVHRWLVPILDRQSLIKRCWDGWCDIPDSSFGAVGGRAAALESLREAGVFRSTVAYLKRRDEAGALAEASSRIEGIPALLGIVSEWLAKASTSETRRRERLALERALTRWQERLSHLDRRLSIRSALWVTLLGLSTATVWLVSRTSETEYFFGVIVFVVHGLYWVVAHYIHRDKAAGEAHLVASVMTYLANERPEAERQTIMELVAALGSKDSPEAAKRLRNIVRSR